MTATQICVEFTLGQLVRWPPAPGKIAQVIELRRTKVRIFYRTRKRGGRERQPIVNAHRLQALQDPNDPLLPLSNPFGRALLKRRVKQFR
jgi:hypothetical protein